MPIDTSIVFDTINQIDTVILTNIDTTIQLSNEQFSILLDGLKSSHVNDFMFKILGAILQFLAIVATIAVVFYQLNRQRKSSLDLQQKEIENNANLQLFYHLKDLLRNANDKLENPQVTVEQSRFAAAHPLTNLL